MPVWLNIILALGGSALISTTIAYFFNKGIKKYEFQQAELRRLEAQERDRVTKDRADSFHKTLLAELADTLVPIREDIAEIGKKLTTSSVMSVTSTRAMLKMLHDQYMSQGYVDTGDKATWNELLENYKDAGGNHFKEYVNIWKEDIDALPLKEGND